MAIEKFCEKANIPLSENIRQALHDDLHNADSVMLGFIFLHWLVASTVTAYSYGFYMLGLIGGGAIALTNLVAYLLLRGTVYMRVIVGISLMLFSAIFIQQHLGRIEMHFHVFLALPILIRYKDIVPLVAAAATTLLHHLIFNYCQVYDVSLFGTPLLVYNYGEGLDITLLHAVFVIIAAIIYSLMIRQNALRFCQNLHMQTENLRMGTELEITHRLQHMLLPKPEELHPIPDLDIAGFMEPTREVGGDYYDVLEHQGRLKIGIGDVTGHGLESGVLMLMVQTAVRTLLTAQVTEPKLFFSYLNQVIYDNLQRIHSDKNLTLTLLDYEKGHLSISGQHEEVLLVRANGEVTCIDTLPLGFMIGMKRDIHDFIDHKDVELYPGDGVVLYTDGVTEAFNSRQEQYGLERLCQIVSRAWGMPSAEVQAEIIADVHRFRGTQKQHDDLTLLVIKQL